MQSRANQLSIIEHRLDDSSMSQGLCSVSPIQRTSSVEKLLFVPDRDPVDQFDHRVAAIASFTILNVRMPLIPRVSS